MLNEHMAKRQQLIEAEAKLHFSYDLEATLTDEERKAGLKLKQMREQLANNHELNRTIHSFYDHKKHMEES